MTTGGARRPNLSAIEKLLFEQVDGASLGAFRIIFGAIMTAGAARYFVYDWLNLLFTEPSYHFKYWGFSWVAQPSPFGLNLLASLLLVSSLMLAIGWFSRVAAVLTFFSFSYLELIDLTNYLNHHYLAALFALLLIFLPASRVYSVDAWLAARRGSPSDARVSALCIYILRFQLMIVYFFAGVAKLGSDWLFYGQPLSIWLTPLTGTMIIGPLLALKWTPLLMSWAGCLYDLSIGFLLLNRNFRPYAFVVVLCFHALTRVFFDIGLFPWIMTGTTLIFFSASWPRNLRVLSQSWIHSKFGASPVTLQPKGSERESLDARLPSSFEKKLVMTVGSIYVVVQVLTPLRAFAYPNDVLWAEDGMRFAWKVMIRQKSASITYVVSSKISDKRTLVSPRRYLNVHQTREMGGQPDMIAQLARHIGTDYLRRWGEPVAVRADTWISLNGRKPTRFLDETVDLAATVDDLKPTSFVLPRPAGPPAQFFD